MHCSVTVIVPHTVVASAKENAAHARHVTIHCQQCLPVPSNVQSRRRQGPWLPALRIPSVHKPTSLHASTNALLQQAGAAPRSPSNSLSLCLYLLLSLSFPLTLPLPPLNLQVHGKHIRIACTASLKTVMHATAKARIQ